MNDPAPSIKWGEFEFHSPSNGRYVTNEPGWSCGSDRLQFVTFELNIEGSTSDEFAQRFKTVFDAINLRDKRLVVKQDKASAESLWDIAPYDGKNGATVAMIELNPNEQQTQFSKNFSVTIAAQLIAFSDASSPLSSLTQLAEAFNYSIQKGAGRQESRSLLITFATKNTEATVAFTINSVDSNGGKARFNLSGAHGVTFKVGLRIYVTATGYNGWHVVDSLTANTFTVQTTYGATATGSITKTATPTYGSEAWTANKSSILTTLMRTASDGARDATSGLALVNEQAQSSDANGQGYTVLLQSEWMPRALATIAASRQLVLECETWEPEVWSTHSGAGPKPLYVAVAAEVAIDKDANGNTNYLQMLNTVQTAMEALAKQESAQNDLKLLNYRYRTMFNRNTVKFDATYQGRNVTIMNYKFKKSKKVDADYVKHIVSDGFVRVQRPNSDPPTFVIHTATRRGIGEIQWLPSELPQPVEGGYQFLQAGIVEDSEPIDSLFGADVYEQTISIVYERVKMQTGDQVRVIPVFTQGGK